MSFQKEAPAHVEFSGDVTEEFIAAIQTVYDPEIASNVYDLGLIYRIAVNGEHAEIDMTLTTPFCPVAQEMPEWVKSAALSVDGIEKVDVNIVWEPQWGQHMIPEGTLLELGLL